MKFIDINWSGETLDTIASLSGKYGRWLNAKGRRLCFMKKQKIITSFSQTQKDFRALFSVSSCYCQFSGKLLLLKRKVHNTWEVPGGKLEANESPSQAVIREIYEETNMVLDPKKISFIRTLYIQYPEIDFTYHMFYQNFSKKPHVKINHREHKDFIWVPINATKEMLSTLGELEALKHYKNFINNLQPTALSVTNESLLQE